LGTANPPPPRKVVLEKLASIPPKPRPILLERWLKYPSTKRRVIYQKCDQPNAQLLKPKNVIIQWEPPECIVKKRVKYLGIVKADPVDYVNKYGKELKLSDDLPDFVKKIKTPDGLRLATESKNDHSYELVGDLEALKLVDLKREGLNDLKCFLNNDEDNDKVQELSRSPKYYSKTSTWSNSNGGGSGDDVCSLVFEKEHTIQSLSEKNSSSSQSDRSGSRNSRNNTHSNRAIKSTRTSERLMKNFFAKLEFLQSSLPDEPNYSVEEIDIECEALNNTV
jgi:hypothetical protein